MIGASARAAAFSLLRAGYQVVAADLFADVDLSRVCPVARVDDYPDGFERWLAETDCDWWQYTGALENYPELIDRLAKLRPLVGHSGDVLRRVRNPLELQRVLTSSGFAFPETHATAGCSPNGDAWLAKSYRGSCGSGISSDDANYWQRRVQGTSLSAVYRGAELLGATRQLVGETWSGAKEFQYCGTIGPWPMEKSKQQTLDDLGRLFANEFGLSALYGIDLIDGGDQLWVIEVNPRYTAAVEVVERLSETTAERFFGKAIVYAKEPVTVTALMTAHFLRQAGESLLPLLADIPGAGTAIEVGQPILTLFADGHSCAAVEDRLRQHTREIEKLLYAKETQPCG